MCVGISQYIYIYIYMGHLWDFTITNENTIGIESCFLSNRLISPKKRLLTKRDWLGNLRTKVEKLLSPSLESMAIFFVSMVIGGW